ncbi:MAG: hypothetical protein KC645_18045, partial [Gemmatimonadetes bacterium]|nr:hypothetical protein [Gemmatimonadota bacterium]
MIDDTLIEAIRQATEGRYRLLAELGHDERRTAFLASESGSGRLTVLLLEEDEGDEQILSVADRLDGRVPGAPVLCPACGDPGRAWGQPCPDCGAGTFGTDPATLGLTIGRVEEDVRAALPEGLTLLGSLPAEPEGAVFFAEDAERGVLAYVLTPADDDELHLALLWREDRPAAAVPPAPAAVELDPEPEPEPGIESDTLGAPPTDYQPPETPWDAPSRAAPLAAPSGGGRGLWLGLLAVGVVGAGAWLLLGGGRGGAEAEPLPPVAV